MRVRMRRLVWSSVNLVYSNEKGVRRRSTCATNTKRLHLVRRQRIWPKRRKNLWTFWAAVILQTSMRKESRAKRCTIRSRLISRGVQGVPSNIKMEETVDNLRIISAGRVSRQVRNEIQCIFKMDQPTTHSSKLGSIHHKSCRKQSLSAPLRKRGKMKRSIQKWWPERPLPTVKLVRSSI